MIDQRLSGKKIIVGISGSIAAYKAVFLVRLLLKSGAEVKVLMTPAAAKFVTPLTLSTLSKHEVLTSVISGEGWNNHVELGLWADAFVIAPATANTIARLANGICDSIISAVYLSARCPVFVAPAMDVDMWHHASTKRNITQLINDQVNLIPVGNGELASGLSGEGRLAEPEDIVKFLGDSLNSNKALSGKQVVITAGPTHEPIDPVRFIGNRSSGKTGVVIVNELLKAGATVNMVAGPVSVSLPQHPNLNIIKVQTAQEMYESVMKYWPKMDIAVMAAAVADYTPTTVSDKKIKKAGDHLEVKLKKTPDIAKAIGAKKNNKQYIVGFALETNNALENAQGKLKRKNFDLIVLNQQSDKHSPFGAEENIVTLISNSGEIKDFPKIKKTAIAKLLVDKIIEDHLKA